MQFSILMCTYNSSATLRQAIESVRKQSFGDWELIILDNGSKDQTVDIIREYEQADERIIANYGTENVGWPKAISLCLKQARGAYMMFLGADDLVADTQVFEAVNREIVTYEPDVVWTGHGLAVFEEGIHKLAKKSCPVHGVYHGENRIAEIAELMRNVYYNSVMHYVSIDFLKRHGIDFYEPFYGDCMGMTEILCKADTMVVLDKVAYILTVNTSQTAGRTGFDYDVKRQWQSIKGVLADSGVSKREDIAYIAERIFKNLEAMYENVALGGALRDRWMNPVERTLAERFLKVEEWLSTDAFGEMTYYSGRRKYEEKMLGVAGVLFWVCAKQEAALKLLHDRSLWLTEFAEAAFELDVQGNVQWKQHISTEDAKRLIGTLESGGNRHRIGAEMLLREDVIYEKKADREQIEALREEYLQRMQ